MDRYSCSGEGIRTHTQGIRLAFFHLNYTTVKRVENHPKINLMRNDNKKDERKPLGCGSFATRTDKYSITLDHKYN